MMRVGYGEPPEGVKLALGTSLRSYNRRVPKPTITIHPVSADRWGDFERLFGPGGAYGGCWCMYFRMRSADNARAKASERKAGIRSLVESGGEPGLIAYVGGEPAGWVSLDPREKFPRIVHSRLFKPIDGGPVWSIVCFVIGKRYRRQRLSERLLAAAIDYARDHCASAVEAYPIEPSEELKGYAGFTGIRSVFERAGFVEVARRENRPTMRLEL